MTDQSPTNRQRPLRIAWIGAPSDGGGVGGFCRQLLSGLIDAGDDITAFVQQPKSDFDRLVNGDKREVRVISRTVDWQWGRWYSRHPTVTFISSFWKRRKAFQQLVDDLVGENAKDPFDVIVQFSQIELFNLRKHLDQLPPVLLFPCVHAAGELRWHRKESAYACQSEGRIRHYLIRSNLAYRARIQKSCCQSVDGVIGMSQRFNELIAQDYQLNPKNQAVIHQPMDSAVFDELDTDLDSKNGGKVKLLFVGRISVRKGIEMLVELSHRLDDLRDRVEIEVIGGGSLWSDYTKHLKNLNSNIARFSGTLENHEVKLRMSQANGLLVPSHYEPGGIVVAEALSHGCGVIVSDEVGSAEPLSGPGCRKFAAGDMNGFESAVRSFVMDARSDASALAQEARHSARHCFGPDNMIRRLREILRLAASGRCISEVESSAKPSLTHSAI